uniref:Gustatory receptor n=1 Tax=Tetranychus urticae TaxID=32264 RepID=T1KCM2_TETUR
MPRMLPIENGSSYAKPIGLFASMVRFEGKKSAFTNFFLILLAICVIFVNIFAKEAITKFTTCEKIFRCTNLVLYVIWLLRIRSKRMKYNAIINLFEAQTRCNLDRPNVRKHLSKSRNIFLFVVTFIALWPPLCDLCHSIMSFQQTGDYISLLKNLSSCLLYLLCHSSFQLYHQFLVESCLNIQACWLTVLDCIRLLDRIDGRTLTLTEIRECRSMFVIAAVTTHKMDSFLRFPIFSYYSFLFILFNVHFVNMLREPTVENLIMVTTQSLHLVFVTFNIIYINYLSNKCFDVVYSLAYKTRSLPVHNEVLLFIDRIEHSKVGFSFLKISLITPTFVTSMASLTLTIALSAPTLFE